MLSQKSPGEIWRNVESKMAGYGEMLFFEKKARLINGRLAAHSIKSLVPFCTAMTKTTSLFAPEIRRLFLEHRHPLMCCFYRKMERWNDSCSAINGLKSDPQISKKRRKDYAEEQEKRRD
jgi:hypothetical protein